MSLQVWLPLNGDLRNQGLANISVTNNGATVNSSGKIGSCYSFDGSSYISITGLSLDNEWSYGCWFYEEASSRSWEGMIIFNNTGGDSDIQLGFYMYPTGSRFQTTANGQYNSSVSHTFDGKWHHLFATFDGSTLKTYKDCVLVNTKTITSSILRRNYLTIGARRRGETSYDCYWKGKMNDLRVYNHCLSLKEIEEIYKCLVLHYKLTKEEPGVENLYKNSSLSDLTSSNLSTKLRYSSSYVPEITKNGFKFTWSGSSAREVGLWLNKSLDSSKTYTLSFIYRSNNSIGTSFYLRNGNTLVGYWAQTTIPQSTDWSLYTCTFQPVSYQSGDVTTGNSLTLFYSGYTSGKWIEIKQYSIKLEEGSSATSWCPAKSDDSYINYPTNIIYDSSGYGHNGTIVGTATISSSSPRYQFSTYMNASSTTNHIETDQLTISTNEITVSFWAYTTKTKSYVLFIDQNMSFCVGSGGTDFWVARTSSKGFPLTEFKTSQWNHVALVKQDSTYKAYINGIEISRTSGNNVWTHQGDKLYLFNRNYNSSYAANAYLSDFRIYATALTYKQILELYNTSAAIDYNGSVFAREVIE